jgi:carbamoyltransferase
MGHEMITLGIHDGHTATAAIARDGKVIACISEERLVREKEWGGFPTHAIKLCLEVAGVSPEQVDGVGYASLMPVTIHKSYDSPTLYKRLFSYATHILPKSYLRSSSWVGLAQWLGRRKNRDEHKRLLAKLGINAPIKYYEHHLLHAATAHLQAPWGKEQNLVITNDGSGDAVCASVNIGRGNNIERLETVSNYNSLGEFYTRTTQYLAMKPMSHEFKLMGLAPYAKESYGMKTYEIIKDWFQLDPQRPLAFENHSGHWRWQYLKAFQNAFHTRHRFDNIAWAAQHLVEEVQTQWIRNIIRETGIRNVVLCGGVFLNVKANHKLLQLAEIEKLFVFPSGGDECLPMGAALLRQVEMGQKTTEPLHTLYLGDAFDDKAIEKELANWAQKLDFERRDDIHEHVGRCLNDGLVIARFFGRMEWGARSLGNRSILADGRRSDVIMRINEAIKNRDFWMPFAPSVLRERVDDYFVVPKKYFSPYMTIAFPSKPLAREHIRGGLHPYDFTGRVQMVGEDWNAEYYRVLKSFETASSGVGGIINTSFNLHGEAIVRTPKDAIETFLNSGLDALAIGTYFVKKKT